MPLEIGRTAELGRGVIVTSVAADARGRRVIALEELKDYVNAIGAEPIDSNTKMLRVVAEHVPLNLLRCPVCTCLYMFLCKGLCTDLAHVEHQARPWHCPP